MNETTVSPLKNTGLKKNKPDRLPALNDAAKVITLLSGLKRRQGLNSEEGQALLVEHRFSTTLRSVQRLLQGLASDPRFPVIVDRNERPFRYRWDEKAPALILPFPEPEEQALLSLARQWLKANVSTGLAHPFLLTTKEAGDFPVRRLPNEFESLPAKVRPEVWRAITTALSLGHYVKLRYRDNRRTLEKVAEPLLLLHQAGKLTILLRERGERDIFAVSLTRMLSAQVTGFEPPADTSFETDAVLSALNLDPSAGPLKRISFLTEDSCFIDSLKETPVSGTQKIKTTADGTLVTFLEHDSQLLKRWLRENRHRITELSVTAFETEVE